MENAETVRSPGLEVRGRWRRIGLCVFNGVGLLLSYLLVYPASAVFLISQLEEKNDWVVMPLLFGGLPCLWLTDLCEPYNDYIYWLADIAGLW